MKQSHFVLKIVVGILLAVCTAGIAFCVIAFVQNKSTETTIEKSQKSLKALENRRNASALTEENVAIAEANLKALEGAQAGKIEYFRVLKRLDSVFEGSQTDLNSTLRTKTDAWTKLLKEQNIEINDAAKFFGFSRYVQSQDRPPKPFLREIDTEAKIIDYLLNSLVKSRTAAQTAAQTAGVLATDKQIFSKLIAIRRESVETNSNAVRSAKSDEFLVAIDDAEAGLARINSSNSSTHSPARFATLRRAGIADALAFQIEFASSTSVLRNFLASLENYPIFVREIKAVRADESIFPPKSTPAAPVDRSSAVPNFDFFLGEDVAGNSTSVAPVAPRVPARTVVVKDLPIIFTVTLEYLTMVNKTEPTAVGMLAAKDEEEND